MCQGGTLPAVLNAANEVAVAAFLDGKITFPAIARTVEAVVKKTEAKGLSDLGSILAADQTARKETEAIVASQNIG